MNGYLLALVAAIYLYVAIEYAMNGKVGMAVAFGAYAMANVGFALDLYNK